MYVCMSVYSLCVCVHVCMTVCMYMTMYVCIVFNCIIIIYWIYINTEVVLKKEFHLSLFIFPLSPSPLPPFPSFPPFKYPVSLPPFLSSSSLPLSFLPFYKLNLLLPSPPPPPPPSPPPLPPPLTRSSCRHCPLLVDLHSGLMNGCIYVQGRLGHKALQIWPSGFKQGHHAKGC